mmetsp:Transcript_23903/g.52718  ORF Transcript_23903/g.52718 Transcript_23903/m.52718 type:complete len:336 (-) Transcript_23903:5-1012(-)
MLVVLCCLWHASATLCRGGGGGVFRDVDWYLQQTSHVTVLDARPRRGDTLPGAVVLWHGTLADNGNLVDVANLQRTFAQAGISGKWQVLVVGDWSMGWGEEGRLLWALRMAGHKDSFILLGGANVIQGVLKNSSYRALVEPWNLTGQLEVSVTEPANTMHALFVDARQPEEFNGTFKQAYGVARSGHITGAISLPFWSLFTNATCLQSCMVVLARMVEEGWDGEQALVTLCTTGVRSSFLWAALEDCSLRSGLQNYDGSMMEWASKEWPMTDPSDSLSRESGSTSASATTQPAPLTTAAAETAGLARQRTPGQVATSLSELPMIWVSIAVGFFAI